MRIRDALIIVDLQNDLCPGGTLAVPKGDRIVPVINNLVQRFSIVVATQDWHPENHSSFASMHAGKKPYDVIEMSGVEQVLWPDHCVQGSYGAELHKLLEMKKVRAIFRKGMDSRVDSYSGFRDNSKESVTGLDGYLKALGVRKIYLTGLATDYCVYYTGIDGLESGYKVSIILDATSGIDVPEGSMEEKLRRFETEGGEIVKSTDFLK